MKRKAGRPRKSLNSEQIREVETLAAVLSMSQICDYFGVSETAFRNMLERDERIKVAYKKGRSRAVESVARGLLAQAREGNVAASIFYLKTQAGWRETDKPESSGQQQEVKIVCDFSGSANTAKDGG
jgi:hypothetical protein